jgi:hypothetical protein
MNNFYDLPIGLKIIFIALSMWTLFQMIVYLRELSLSKIKEGTKFIVVTSAGKQIIQIRKGGIWQYYSKYPNAKGDCEEYWM